MLHVAYPLVEAGFRVRVLDMRLEDYRDFELAVLFSLDKHMSGLQIHFALESPRKSEMKTRRAQ